ncbi:hypothetical protein J6590_002370 [Homalodisca vitripennis]|nr:hypothetical protein J6590_002370 [Homalodisca vitripennis]
MIRTINLIRVQIIGWYKFTLYVKQCSKGRVLSIFICMPLSVVYALYFSRTKKNFLLNPCFFRDLAERCTTSTKLGRTSAPGKAQSAKSFFACLTCGRRYRQKHHLKRHVEYECNVEPRFQCRHCGDKFRHNHSMQRHMLNMHQPQFMNNC